MAGGFLDEAEVLFTSGKGGDGAASFHREKHVPRGGPNGANGGRGGDIILKADHHKRTLYDFQLRNHYEAKNGSQAIGNKDGKTAENVVIHVPVGTVVYDLDLEETLADLSVDGMEVVLCRGGRGGFGNTHFTNSVRQAPTFAQLGAPGEQVRARLELKLIAEVGLIGLPNAGKSTLLSAMSAAKPKIGNYPFTTITPNLGVVTVADSTFTIADLPGLIEGASEGHGLGHQFLRHAERNKVLLHVIDAFPLDETDPRANYELIEAELESYSPELAALPRVVAVNKMDVLNPDQRNEALEAFDDVGHPVFAISGVSGEGIEELKFALWSEIEKSQPIEAEVTVLKPIAELKRDNSWSVEKQGDTYFVLGARVERLVAMTNLDNRDALHYLYRKLQRIGVIRELEKLGAEDGDAVKVGTFEFTFTDW